MYSGCHSGTSFFVLRGAKQFPDLAGSCACCPDHSRCIDVSTRGYSIRQAVTSNVQSDKTIRTEPLHEPSHKGRDILLSCVCPCLALRFLCSPIKLTFNDYE